MPKHHRDRDESSSHKHKKKKDRDRDGKEKHKSKKEVNYAEPEVPYLPPAALLPPRPEILDEPPLPHPSKWVKPYDPVDVKKAKGIISKVQGMREAFFFLQPVDRYALPMYVDISFLLSYAELICLSPAATTRRSLSRWTFKR